MSACIIIPARFASSRLPGKPLVNLLGKPMILWVAEQCAKAIDKEHVIIATDDRRIADTVSDFGFQYAMTSSEAQTGTDRIAEAALSIDYDVIVNVQGDEPLVDPADIQTCIKLKSEHPEYIFNGYCEISDDEDPQSANIPKVITNENDDMVYMSRLPVPGFKTPNCKPTKYKKQVCIYGFSQSDLNAFSAFGRKSKLESHEDIEILRFLELGRSVKMFKVKPGSVAVDVESDIAVAEALLKRAN